VSQVYVVDPNGSEPKNLTVPDFAGHVKRKQAAGGGNAAVGGEWELWSGSGKSS